MIRKREDYLMTLCPSPVSYASLHVLGLGPGDPSLLSPEAAAALACDAIRKGKRLQYISRRWSLIGLILRCLALFR